MPHLVLGQVLRNWIIRELTQFQTLAALITWWSVITEMEGVVELVLQQRKGRFLVQKEGRKRMNIYWAPTMHQTLCWRIWHILHELAHWILAMPLWKRDSHLSFVDEETKGHGGRQGEIQENPQNHRISELEGTWNVLSLIINWCINLQVNSFTLQILIEHLLFLNTVLGLGGHVIKNKRGYPHECLSSWSLHWKHEKNE